MNEIIVDRCGHTCPFFESDNQTKNKNCKCFLNPLISTWRYGLKPQQRGMMPKNCPMKKQKKLTVICKE